MKLAVPLLVLLLTFSSSAQIPSRPTPILVELFTSEGCSSCPPADQLLMDLLDRQPVPGVEIIGLSEHVDYWNQLGWKDPFSAAQFTRRQSDYGESYTPEMVVDGAASFVGSDRAQAISAITNAARKTKSGITLTADGLKLHIGVPKGEAAEVYLAIAENNLSSNVTRGENEGLKMAHAAVVRKLTSIGRVATSAEFSSDLVVSAGKGWKREDLRAVVFVQSSRTRYILSAASVALNQ